MPVKTFLTLGNKGGEIWARRIKPDLLKVLLFSITRIISQILTFGAINNCELRTGGDVEAASQGGDHLREVMGRSCNNVEFKWILHFKEKTWSQRGLSENCI